MLALNLRTMWSWRLPLSRSGNLIVENTGMSQSLVAGYDGNAPLVSLPVYTTLLFDLDHTLLDSNASEDAAFDLTMRAVGAEEPSRYRAAYDRINGALWASVEAGEITPDEVRFARFDALIAETGLDANTQEMADLFVGGLGNNGELYPGVINVLDQLVTKVKMAMITNGISFVQRTRIERLGLNDYFDTVIVSTEVGAAKPGTEIFDHAFADLGHPAKESALMIGDSLTSDIKGGTNYGIATCWYNPHRKAAGPTDSISHEITSIDEVLALV